MNMPGGIEFRESEHSYFGRNITAAVNNGTLPEERLDDMCRRIMTPYYYFDQSSFPPADSGSFDLNFWLWTGTQWLDTRSYVGDADRAQRRTCSTTSPSVQPTLTSAITTPRRFERRVLRA